MYTAVKHIHLTCIALSVLLFVIRFFWTMTSSSMLQKKWVKITPHIVDTLLILSAATLCVMISQYPFVTPWVTEKFVGLLMYVFMVALALKMARTNFMRVVGLVGALSWIAFTALVAISKQPILFA
ncbi:Invasion gene expression up-regulator, SirB [Paraglaciecola sp. T6c]|uniref:SirB2 family protein n=1 Tax=Pseudoalteromonas atlantica (strain T6c / ATCC BAA-1087) TaxID=3042615 RepID=UPI00005C6746|nr:SirB2 family protein [Paraglaciecola sp. T6c]ABG41076.1 Invasion gene expression up-regulator, SirB [Paraglaciecola sp. T6c]